MRSMAASGDSSRQPHRPLRTFEAAAIQAIDVDLPPTGHVHEHAACDPGAIGPLADLGCDVHSMSMVRHARIDEDRFEPSTFLHAAVGPDLDLDIEGHEVAALSSLDFGAVTIDVVLVETAQQLVPLGIAT